MAAPRIPGLGGRIVRNRVIPAPAPPRTVVAPPPPARTRPETPRASLPAAPPPVPATLSPTPPIDPEPPIPREVPAGLVDSKIAEWLVAAIRAHEVLREKSFYDTGRFLAVLLDRHRDRFGAKDIKELCVKAGLGMSHMTANKYLQIARAFHREAALAIGIEKAYALTSYAKITGRPGTAAAILESNELVRGTRVRAQAATAKQIKDAIKAMKAASREAAVPSAERAAFEQAATSVQGVLRKLGFRNAIAKLVFAGGEPRVSITISTDTARAIDSELPRALARFGAQLARTRPESFAPLRAAGWRPR